MLTAIAHRVSPRISECELTFIERSPIDLDAASLQHEDYCAALEQLGVAVNLLSGNEEFPDSVFVEDTAVVFDEVAVICRPGAPSRRGETALIEQELSHYRPTVAISAPATVDGGDVLSVGKQVFVGISSRTDRGGLEQLARILAPFGYKVMGVETNSSLHLKSACTAVDDETLILNTDWVDPGLFSGFRLLFTAPGESHAANVLRVGETVCVQPSFPRTTEAIEKLGKKVVLIDNSELSKAEAALTCSSIIFEA